MREYQVKRAMPSRIDRVGQTPTASRDGHSVGDVRQHPTYKTAASNDTGAEVVNSRMETPRDPSGFVHDFKNQLGIVLGFAELLIAATPDEDPRKADIREIRDAAQTALGLVERLESTLHPDGE